ncbi:MAG: HMA2 domain-containing protein [Succinivibrio sp.]
MLNFLSQFFNEKKYFLSTVTVASYIPGRIRGYSSLIRGNHANAKALGEYFSQFKELDSFSINETTGSILIEYDVEKLALNRELQEIEQCLKAKARK